MFPWRESNHFQVDTENISQSEISLKYAIQTCFLTTLSFHSNSRSHQKITTHGSQSSNSQQRSSSACCLPLGSPGTGPLRLRVLASHCLLSRPGPLPTVMWSEVIYSPLCTSVSLSKGTPADVASRFVVSPKRESAQYLVFCVPSTSVRY